MLAPTAPQFARPSRLLPVAATPLVLAIRGGEHDGRLIRIRSAKCTIGSAAGCTLRLRSPGVKPLHCWILRGPGGTIVRRCAGDAQLNGAGFLDAPLAPGFRLRVGPVELEIIRCPVAPREAFLAPPVVDRDPNREALEQSAQEAAEKVTRLQAEQAAIAAEKSAISAGLDALTAERDALLEKQDALAKNMSALAAEKDALAAEKTAREQHLARQIAEAQAGLIRVQSERDLLSEQTRSLNEALAQLRQDSATQTALSSNLREEATGLRTRLVGLQHDSQAELARLQQLLTARERELESLRRDAAEAGNHSVQMTQRLDQLERTSQDEQARLEQERNTLASEAQSLRDALADMTRQLQVAQSVQQQLDASTAERRALQAELAAGQEQIAELQAQLAATREKLAAAQLQTPAEAEARPGSAEAAGQTISLFPPDNTPAIHALENRIQELEAALRQERADLASQRAELETSRAQLAQMQDQSVSQHRELEENIAAKEQLLNRQAVELSDQLERVESRRAELDRREQNLRDEAEQNELFRGKLRQCQAELDEQRLALEQRAAELDSRPAQPLEPEVCEAPLPPACAQEESQPELVAESPLPEAAPALLEQQADAEPAPISASESQSVESVLSRLMQAGVWKEDSAPETPAETPNQAPAAENPAAEAPAEPEPQAGIDSPELAALPEPETPAAEIPLAATNSAAAISSKPVWTEPAQPAPADDESIESYMDRLLKRVRGESSGAPQQRQPYQPAQSSAAKTPDPLPEIKPVAMVQETVKPEEYIPRSQAPEQGVNLAAMRELANSAARSAIEKHAKTCGGKQAMGSFAGFGLCVGLTIAMLVLFCFLRSWVVGTGALFGVSVSVYWAFQGTRHMLGVMRLGKPASQPAKAADEVAQETATQARTANEGK